MLHYDLGQLRAGDSVEVALDRQANVLLLNDANLSRYRRGQRCEHYGGRAVRSPLRIAPAGPDN